MLLFRYSWKNTISTDENTSLIEKPGTHQIYHTRNQ